MFLISRYSLIQLKARLAGELERRRRTYRTATAESSISTFTFPNGNITRSIAPSECKVPITRYDYLHIAVRSESWAARRMRRLSDVREQGW
jgi:hypothetical protein